MQKKKKNVMRHKQSEEDKKMSLSATLLVGLTIQNAPPHPDAKSACAAMNTSMLIEVMHGFGEISGYSRNSGCGE